MEKGVPVCQSCGMPMNFESDFGTKEDGSLNKEYCCYCVLGGKFVNPDLTLDEQIERMVSIAKDKMDMDTEEAREMALKVLPKLKRWKK